MKIKILMILMLIFIGCEKEPETKEANEHAVEKEDVFGGRFKEGKGVELSDVTKASLGVETVEAKEEKNGSLIPASSILETAEGKFIYVENGTYFIRTAVTIANQRNEMVEISDGLYAGDIVVKKPVDFLWYVELQAIRGGVACADGH